MQSNLQYTILNASITELEFKAECSWSHCIKVLQAPAENHYMYQYAGRTVTKNHHVHTATTFQTFDTNFQSQIFLKQDVLTLIRPPETMTDLMPL